eukprot:gene12245-16332_t
MPIAALRFPPRSSLFARTLPSPAPTLVRTEVRCGHGRSRHITRGTAPSALIIVGRRMTDGLTLAFHGASRTVTGSCMEFCHAGKRVLVDCGLFQGSRTLETLNRAPFAFDAAKVDAVILTHAHIDHSGLLPRLLAEGFAGDIWCTEQTAALLEFMLADAG